MQFYYFVLKRYQRSYQQLKCILGFLCMLLPVSILILLVHHYSPLIFQLLLLLSGWATWTFIEYILHRFWMHNKNSVSSLAQTHHYHHSHPTEIAITVVHRTAMVIFLLLIL